MPWTKDSGQKVNVKKWKSLSRVQFFVTPWTTHSMEFSRPEYWSGQPFLSAGNLPNPGIKPRSPALQADYSLPAEPQRKCKNTGVGSLSLLQWIYPTKKLNQGLLHCRQFLYQLSSQGSPRKLMICINWKWDLLYWKHRGFTGENFMSEILILSLALLIQIACLCIS